MNKFYYFEGNIYETEEEVLKATQNYNNKRFDAIETIKEWFDFENDFNKAKSNGESDTDAIEIAR